MARSDVPPRRSLQRGAVRPMTAAVSRITWPRPRSTRVGSQSPKQLGLEVHPMATHGNGRTRDGAAGLAEWRDHTRVFLQPIAAPSILGLFGFAAATFMVAANLAGWYGGKASPEF